MLSNSNFASLGSQVKFINTMKYCPSSLGKLASPIDDLEKMRIEELTRQLLNQHNYFSQIWQERSYVWRRKILDIIVSGKGVFLYQKIKTIDSLSLKPENSIYFIKGEFHSMLKGCFVDDAKFNISKILYSLLKMVNMSNLNNLYNAQDMIILCEIVENRFQTMFDVSGGCNPRKIDSASKLSGCIQCEKSKVILGLSTNNSIMETFEKTLTRSFSSVNTRLLFDTELLMPNFIPAKYNKMKIDKSFQAYKRDDLKAIYRIKFDDKPVYKERHVITKTFKLDENNKYGYPMTKPMPTGCIK